MTVYILFEDDCECPMCVVGVYDSEEKALKEKEEHEKHWGYYFIQEEEVL